MNTPQLAAPSRRGMLHGFAGLTAGIVLAACGPQPAGQSQTPSAASGGAGGHLRMRLWRAPDGLDPAYAWGIEAETVQLNVFSGLVTYNAKTSVIEPDLAEKWETPDGRVWKFSLRKGVQWQKGYGAFTARDVKYSFERILDPKTGSLYTSELIGIEKIETPDDLTVTITLKEPDYSFLHAVANYHQGAIVKKEAVEKLGEQHRTLPIGTGPFEVESFTPNAEVRLTRFDAYWKGPAKVERVTFRVIIDAATAEIALMNKEIDVSGQQSDPAILTRMLKDTRLQMFDRKGVSVSLMVPNTTVKPLDNPLVRRAMMHAINFDGNLKAISGEFAGTAFNILPSTLPTYTKDVPRYAFDPKKAKELLQQAGAGSGFTVKDLGEASDAAVLLQRDLAAVGITLEFENVTDRALNNQRRNNGQFQLASRLTPGVNTDSLLSQYLHPSAFPPAGLNGARYSSSEVTKMLEQVRREADEKKRLTLYHAIQKQAMADVPYFPRSESFLFYPAWPNVKGIEINGLSQVPLHAVTVQ